MVTDARYTDNVVLKRAAYQELLTGIKHYPIVDIDYMEEWDTDDRTNRQIWSGYTEDSPCIKITYGDPQTTKGNIIFSTKFRKAIQDLKREIESLQNAIARKEDYLDRLKKIYNDNNTVLINETRYLQAYAAEQLETADQDADKVRQLLNGSAASLIQMVSAVAHTNPQTAEQFEGFSENTIQEINFTEGFFEIKGTSWSTVMLATDEPDSIYYHYPKPFNLIPDGAPYYIYDPVNKTWNNATKTSSSSSDEPRYVFTQVSRDEVEEKQNERLYLKVYHDFDAIRATIAIPLYKMAYSKYIAAGLSDEKHNPDPSKGEDLIKAFYDMVVEFINLLEAYETNWGYYSNYNETDYTPDLDSLQLGTKFQAMSTTILNYIESFFIKELKSKIDVTAEHYNIHYGSSDGTDLVASDNSTVPYDQTLLGLKARITEAEEQIAEYEDWINQVAEGKAIVNTNGDGIEETTNGIDRRMFGYKYVKVGSNIHFDATYTKSQQYWCPGKGKTAFALEKTGNAILSGENYTAESQASGTFRISINNHIYEIPIKGFTDVESNKSIYIKTWHTTDNGVDSYGNINFQGNLVGTGNIVTNNGHIYASAGSIGAKHYLAMRGYKDPNNDFNDQLTAGFYYDGTNDIIRTWDINDDDNSTGLGTHTLVLIQKAGANGDKSYDSTPVGIQNNGGTLEVRNLPTNNDYAPIKAKGMTSTGNVIPNTNGSGSLGDTNHYWNNLYVNNITSGDHVPKTAGSNTTGNDLGKADNRWKNIYGYNGNFTNLTLNGVNLTTIAKGGYTNQFWIGGKTSADDTTASAGWGNTLTGRLYLSNSGYGSSAGYKHTDSTQPSGSNYLLRVNGNGYFDGNLKGNKVFSAVFNDYAEYRTTIDLEPGRVVVDNDDGTLSCSSQRLQPGGQVISDTFGSSMGETDECKTPLAVAGRVLVYTYQDRENYHAGMAVCTAPNGTIDIMTREEIKEYPDCIIGIVSEIPQYDIWGTNNIKVNNRIWIKVK